MEKIKKLQTAERVLKLAGAKLERIDGDLISPLVAGLGDDNLMHRLYLLFGEFKPITVPSKTLFHVLKDKESSIFAGADVILEALGEEPFYYKEFGKLLLRGAEVAAIRNSLFAELIMEKLKKDDYIRSEGVYAKLGGRVLGQALLTAVGNQYGSLNREPALEKAENRLLEFMGEDIPNREFLSGVLEVFRERKFKLSADSKLAQSLLEMTTFLGNDKEVADIIYVASPYINKHFTPKDLKSLVEVFCYKETGDRKFTETFKILAETVEKKDLVIAIQNIYSEREIDNREEVEKALEKRAIERKVEQIRDRKERKR